MKTILKKWDHFIQEDESPKVVTFDFDDTLLEFEYTREDGYFVIGPMKKSIEKLKEHKAKGSTVYIVTSRYDEEGMTPEQWSGLEKDDPYYVPMVQEFLDEHDIVVDGIYFTNGRLKAKTLITVGSSIHYDDDLHEVAEIRKIAPHIQVVDPWEI